MRCQLRNWWELPGVSDLCRQLFPVGEGSHATPSEVSVTWFGYPEAVNHAAMSPRIAPSGPVLDAEDFRRRFPDGRIGSDPSQASIAAGEKIVALAVKGVINEFRQSSISLRPREPIASQGRGGLNCLLPGVRRKLLRPAWCRVPLNLIRLKPA